MLQQQQNRDERVTRMQELLVSASAMSCGLGPHDQPGEYFCRQDVVEHAIPTRMLRAFTGN